MDDQVHAGSKIKGVEGHLFQKGCCSERNAQHSLLTSHGGLFFHLRRGDDCFWLCVLPSAGGRCICVCFWKEPVERLSN